MQITKPKKPDALTILMSVKSNINEIAEMHRKVYIWKMVRDNGAVGANIFCRAGGVVDVENAPKHADVQRAMSNMVWRRAEISRLLAELDALVFNKKTERGAA